MKVFVVYCHPSEDSFTSKVRDEFLRGLEEANHDYEISDLYKMNFKETLTEEEYIRESYYIKENEVLPDVKKEQSKIQNADAIVFIYPFFWNDVPAKLKGWFDRVFTFGFAYGANEGDSGSMKLLEKAIAIGIAGNTREELEKTGRIQAMECTMLQDRLGDRAKECQFHLLDGMSRAYMPARLGNWYQHLAHVYNVAKNL